MTLEERAKEIAAEANQCCLRSDGYLEEIEELALRHLQEAVAEEWEACAVAIEKPVSGNLQQHPVYELSRREAAAFIRARGTP